MKKCKRCGFIVPNNVDICSNCNGMLSNRREYTYVCDKCGAEFQDSDMVCPKCNCKAEFFGQTENLISQYNLLINSNENENKNTNIDDDSEQNAVDENTAEISKHNNKVKDVLNIIKNKKRIIFMVAAFLVILALGINLVSKTNDIKFIEFKNTSKSIDVYAWNQENIRLDDEIAIVTIKKGLNYGKNYISIVDLKSNQILEEFDPYINDTIYAFEVMTDDKEEKFWLLRGSAGKMAATDIWFIGRKNNGDYGVVFQSRRLFQNKNFAGGMPVDEIDAEIRDNKIILIPKFRFKRYYNNVAVLTWDNEKHVFDYYLTNIAENTEKNYRIM